MPVRGDVDEISRASVLGWVMDTDRPQDGVEVAIRVNGRVVARFPALRYRASLKDYLEPGATGEYEFYHEFVPPLSVFQRHEISVTVDGANDLPRRFSKVLPRPGEPIGTLTPVIVTSTGRSGTTLLMSEFARQSGIVVADLHPYEIKQVAYYASAFRALASNEDRTHSTDPDRMFVDDDRYRIGHNPYNSPGFFSISGQKPALRRHFEEDLPETLRTTFRDLILRYYRILQGGQGKQDAMFFAEKGDIDEAAREGARLFFGRVREIVLVRDPLDMLCSAMSFWKLPAAEAIAMLKTTLPRLEEIRRNADSDTLFIRYEDLIRQPEATREEMYRFIGVPEDTARKGVDGAALFGVHGTSSNPDSSMGRWKTDLQPSDIDACEIAFHSYSALFGYTTATEALGRAARGLPDVSALPALSTIAAPALDPVFDLVPQATGTLAGYLGEGWSPIEDDYVWTKASQSWLHLPRPDMPADYLLRIVGKPFLYEKRLTSQRIRVEVNGCAVGEAKLLDRDTLEYSLPWHLLSTRPAIDVMLGLPDALRPCDIQGGNDDRLLGLSLLRLSLLRLGGALHDKAPHRPSPDALAAAAMLTPAELMAKFESIGENCEFGLVQRRCDIEPLGLLRFSSAPLPKLMNALRARFEGLGSLDMLEARLSENGREYMVEDKRFGFLYHAWTLAAEALPEQIELRESRRVPLLVRKLIEDLTLGEKIFVFHGMDPLSISDALELAVIVQSYGPNVVLWVELADSKHPAGTVEQIVPGLLKGFMDRFAPGDDAYDLSLDCWIKVCKASLALVSE